MIRPVVYIAGPFRAATAWEIESHVRRAEALALWVWRNGMVALCPHTNTRFFHGAAPDEVWLEGDLELLRRCDAVALVEGWEQSSGARAEVEEAKREGLLIFEPDAESRDCLIAWGYAWTQNRMVSGRPRRLR